MLFSSNLDNHTDVVDVPDSDIDESDSDFADELENLHTFLALEM